MQRFRTLSPLPSLVRPKRAYCRARGCPRNIFLVGILIFLLLGSPCQISKPYDNPFWEKVTVPERKKKERRIMTIIVANRS